MSVVYDVIVIGAGQAGLAAGYHLQRSGLSFVILEASDQPAGSWPKYYDSLTLFSPARYSELPGLAFPGAPDHYPTRDEVVEYLIHYASHFDLPVELNIRAVAVRREGTQFEVRTSDRRRFLAHSLVAATGSFHRPYIPEVPEREQFQGKLLHSFQYRNADSFQGQRVVVVGAGNSAVQIAVELATIANVTLATREPVKFVPQVILGKDLHFWLQVTGLDTLPLGYLTEIGSAGVS